VNSRPGDTRFEVRLPMAGVQGAVDVPQGRKLSY